VPLAPVPAPPAAIVNHDAFEVADQLHAPPLVATVTLPVPPRLEIVAQFGLIDSTSHPSCITVWVCPSAVIVAVREGPSLAATK
jgi:hypothetical protein